jgi:septal ring factor EnvC (AmiA/AmiB activator)
MKTHEQINTDNQRPLWLVWREKETDYKSRITELESLLAASQAQAEKLGKSLAKLNSETAHVMAQERANRRAAA